MSEFEPGAYGSEWDKFWWNCVCGGCENYAEVTLQNEEENGGHCILLYIEQPGPLKLYVDMTPLALVDCIHWDGLQFESDDVAASIELDVEIEWALKRWLAERGVVLPPPSERSEG